MLLKPRVRITDEGMESPMQQSLHAEIIALLRAAIHITATLIIVWYFYRVANGQTSLL
jgi:hypothetical protein